MKHKNLLVPGLAVFVVFQVLDFLNHGILLAPYYEASSDLWRSNDEVMSNMWIMLPVGLVWAFIFVYIFSFVRKAAGIGDGVRFGFCMGLFVSLPMALNTYATMPVPIQLSLGWLAGGIANNVVCGAVAALVYKPGQAAG